MFEHSKGADLLKSSGNLDIAAREDAGTPAFALPVSSHGQPCRPIGEAGRAGFEIQVMR
jgi:hypothetical protein